MLARTWTRFAQWNEQFGSRPLPLLRHTQSRGPGWDIRPLRILPNFGITCPLLAVPDDLFSLCLDQNLLEFRFHCVTVKALRHCAKFIIICEHFSFQSFFCHEMPHPSLEKRSIDSDLCVLDLHRSQGRLCRLYEELGGHPLKKLCNVSMCHFPVFVIVINLSCFSQM